MNINQNLLIIFYSLRRFVPLSQLQYNDHKMLASHLWEGHKFLIYIYVQIKNNLKLHSSIKSCNSIDLIQLTTADSWFLLLVSDVFLLYFIFTLHAILFLSSHSLFFSLSIYVFLGIPHPSWLGEVKPSFKWPMSIICV